VLSEVGIDAFLAHEDLEVSAEWRDRILEELRGCHLFVVLLSANFVASRWGAQEVGFIVSRPEVVIAPLSVDGTTSFGFISHLQSRRIPAGGITRELLVIPLARKSPRHILPGLINLAIGAGSFRGAEALMAPLVPFFGSMTSTEAQALAEGAISNNQVWSAGRCRAEYLPAFIKAQAHQISPKALRALEYQVENDEPYYEEAPEA
jgi:TIR domain-containing protein